MYAEILRDASFLDALRALDEELGRATQARGCSSCGAPLDAGHYLRKPRGGPWAVSNSQCIRLSYCCRRDGCRRRALPPSVQFLGRRVYVGALVVLAGVLLQGPTAWRVVRLADTMGADRRTLARWHRWWTTTMARSRTFEIGRADFMPPPSGHALPLSLVSSFEGTADVRVVSTLKWLGTQFGSRFPVDADAPAEDAR